MKPALDQLVLAIRDIYARDPHRAEEGIEVFLAGELQALSPQQRMEVLARLEDHFMPGGPAAAQGITDEFMEHIIPLLLGRNIQAGTLTGPELAGRLGEALNKVFSTLNELIAVINTTLGGSPAGDETIRHIIGGTLGGEHQGMSIEEYLGRIRQAFLAAQQSSRDAAWTIAGYIMTELDPANMEPLSGGFRIGPMKKAEAFELFEEKYKRVRKWYDSERFLLDFLRQFEKNCQKSFT